MAALYQLFREKPRTGWVRANNLPTSSVLNELAALSEEKRILQDRVSSLTDNERLKIPDTAIWRIQHLNSTTIGDLMDYEPVEGELSVLEHFEYAVPILVEGCKIRDLREQIESVGNLSYENEAAEGIVRELMTQNLVAAEAYYPNGYGSFPSYTYRLSDYGKEFFMFFKEWQSRERHKAMSESEL